MWDRLKEYLLKQGKDAATWRGMVLVSTSIFGTVKLKTEETATLVIFLGMFITGLISILQPPKPPKEDKDAKPHDTP